MQRTFVFLLGWIAVFSALGLAVFWWMGPSLANLAFLDSKSDQPFQVLEFLRGSDTQTLSGDYEEPLMALIQAEEGQMQPGFSLQHVTRGVVADEWQRLVSYSVASASQAVEIMTTSAYRDLGAQSPDLEVLRLGTYQTVAPNQWQGAIIIYLAVVREASTVDPLITLKGLLDPGQILLDDEEPHVLSGDAQWNRLVVLSFADQDAAAAWLASRDVALENDILNSKVQRMAVMLYAR